MQRYTISAVTEITKIYTTQVFLSKGLDFCKIVKFVVFHQHHVTESALGRVNSARTFIYEEVIKRKAYCLCKNIKVYKLN